MVGATERLQLAGLRRIGLSPATVLVALTAIAGVVLRVWTYRSPLTIPNSDEALIGLMVRHAEHGQFTTFFWGRPYGGTQEVLLAVPGFLLFGPSFLALRMVPIALSVLATFLIWRVGRRTIGEPGAAVAAGLFWVWPPFDFLQFVRAQGFYASGVVYCALILLLALRVVEKPDRLRVGVFGLVLGLAFWQSAQITPIALTAVAWTIWKAPRCLRQAWVAVPAALLGALPWLVWNIGHGFASLSQNPAVATYERSLRLLASPILPMTLGLRAPYADTPIVTPSALFYLLYVACLALFAFGAYRSRGRALSLLYCVAIVFPFLYALPAKTSYISAYPQYTTILTPLLALFVAQVGSTHWRGAALILLACLVTSVSLHRMQAWLSTPQPLPTAPRSLSPLIARLDALHLDRVYADYWIAYLLDFDSGERIIAVENQFSSLRFAGGQATPSDDPAVRYAPYQSEVEAARHGFVFWRQTVGTIRVVPALLRDGYRRSSVGPWVVFAPPGDG